MRPAPPAVYADFNNQDPEGRLRLTYGTRQDLKSLGLELEPGMELRFVQEDVAADGRVEWSDSEGIWVGVIVDWIGP